jgi:hypothetical protein
MIEKQIIFRLKSVFFISILFYACSTYDVKSIKLEPIRATKFSNSIAEKISNYRAHHLLTKDERMCLSYIDVEEKEIVVYDIFSDTTIYKINLSPIDSLLKNTLPQLNIAKDINYCFNNGDSIFIVANGINAIYMINQMGDVIKVTNVRNIKGADVKSFALQYMPCAPLTYHKNSIHMLSIGTDAPVRTLDERKKYFNTPSYMVLNIESDVGKIQPYNFPHNYRSGNCYYDYHPIYALSENGEVVISFAFNDTVYLYQGENLIKSAAIKSNYYVAAKEFDENRYTDFNYVMEYYMTEGKYYKTIYDKYKKLYYRIYLHHSKYLTSDETEINDKRNWSLIIFDSELNKLGELEFDSRKNGIDVIPTKNGIAIPNIATDTSVFSFTEYSLNFKSQ